jgi:hypothetical protein
MKVAGSCHKRAHALPWSVGREGIEQHRRQ